MSKIEFDLDNPREVMYDELVEEFGEELVETILSDALQRELTNVYDNRETIRQRIEQQQG